jgi:hypothetical protein
MALAYIGSRSCEPSESRCPPASTAKRARSGLVDPVSPERGPPRRRLDALGAFVAAYEAEHGEIAPEAIRDAARRARARAIVAGPKPAEPTQVRKAGRRR